MARFVPTMLTQPVVAKETASTLVKRPRPGRRDGCRTSAPRKPSS